MNVKSETKNLLKSKSRPSSAECGNWI